MKGYLLIMFFFVVNSIYSQQNKITFIVEPYIQNAVVDGITVVWETNLPANGIVKFGKARMKSNSVNFDQFAKTSTTEKLQSVRLNKLDPGTKYFYKVIVIAGRDTIESETNPFMTSINSECPVTFAIFGDSQQQDDTTVWNRMSTMALLERPNFGLIVGDLVDEGARLNQWQNEFLNNGHEFMKAIPLFSVVGNHDIINDPDALNFHKYMKTPGNKNYYTFTYADIQVYVIDSNDEMEKGSTQYKWLENELAKSKKEWKIVAHHHPPYSSDMDDFGDTRVSFPSEGDPNFEDLIPLYEKFNVDMVFYGHIHSYERTYPLLNKEAVNIGGVVYVQCGGAGGNLEVSGVIRSWYTAKVKSTHHYCLVSVNKSKLYFSAYDNNGIIFDQYTIDKSKNNFNSQTNISNKLSAPVFKYVSNKFIDQVEVSIHDYNENTQIRYTTDGTLPNPKSMLYDSPIPLGESTIITAVVVNEYGDCSKKSIQNFTKIIAKESMNVKPNNKGLIYRYYKGKGWNYIPEFKNLNSSKEGKINNFILGDIKDHEDQFAITFSGYINIETEGIYEFYCYSDDGTKLFIDDELVVDNDGSHSPRTRKGSVALKKGYHKIYLEYFEDSEGEVLSVSYKLYNSEKEQIPDSKLFY